MSKPADKQAHRSALKANLLRGPMLRAVRRPIPPKTSWWIVGAAPSDRDQFIAAAHRRSSEVWSTTVAHATDPSKAYR